MIRIGISTASLYPQCIETTLRQFGERGVRWAEAFLNTFSELQPDFVRELRRIADDGGVRVVSIHPFTSGFEPFLLFTGYERRFADALEFHKPYFEAANLLGAEIFVFHGDKYRGSGKSPTTDAEYFERYARLRDLGRSFGVTVAQENVERCRSRDLGFLRAMARELDGDVAFVLDNKQALRSGVDWREFVEALGPWIAHCHLSDHGPAGDCLPVGEGTLDFQSLFAALAAQGYTGAALVELYGEQLADRDVVFESCQRLTKLADDSFGRASALPKRASGCIF